jgi:hypothetical protein
MHVDQQSQAGHHDLLCAIMTVQTQDQDSHADNIPKQLVIEPIGLARVKWMLMVYYSEVRCLGMWVGQGQEEKGGHGEEKHAKC